MGNLSGKFFPRKTRHSLSAGQVSIRHHLCGTHAHEHVTPPTAPPHTTTPALYVLEGSGGTGRGRGNSLSWSLTTPRPHRCLQAGEWKLKETKKAEDAEDGFGICLEVQE